MSSHTVTSIEAGIGKIPGAPLLVTACVYAVTYALVLLLPFDQHLALVHAPTGMALSTLLIFGRRVWPGITAGALAARLLVHGDQLGLLAAVGMSVIDTAEATLAWYLLTRVHGFRLELDRIHDVLGLFFWAASLTPALGALATVIVLKGWDVAPPRSGWIIFLERWLWSGISVMLIGNLVLTWHAHRPRWPRGRMLLETLGLAIVLPLACELAFGSRIMAVHASYPLAFVVFPFVMLAAIRFGPFGAALASSGTTFFAMARMMDLREFGSWTTYSYEPLIVHYTFTAATSTTALITAAALAERRRADLERRLRAREFRAVLEAVPDVLLVLSRDGRVRGVFTANEEQLTAPSASLTGRRLVDVVPRGDAVLAQSVVESVIESNTAESIEYAVDIRGDQKWFFARVVPFGTSDDPCVLWVARDVTELMQAHRRTKSGERLLRKLLRLQEQERKMLSYEIHDGLMQFMVGAHMAIESVRDELDLNTAEVRHQMRWCQDLIGKAIQEARQMISELRPMIIDEQGVVQAVRYLLEEHASDTIDIQFTHRLEEERLPSLLEGTIFRIVQDALDNITQHSRATRASIVIRQVLDVVSIVIEDNGVGFDKRNIPENRFGVEGIVKRAQLFGGQADICTAPGQGTKITVQLPLTAPEDDPRPEIDDSVWRAV